MRNARYDIRNTQYAIRNTQYENAFTIVELLLALAITSILLAAVAVAFNASVINYRENEDIFTAMNSARQALFRITTQLRTAGSVKYDAPANECTFNTASEDSITYRYDNTDGKLYLITNDDASDDDYVLCDNVIAMTCTKNTVVEGALTTVKSVQISITVASGRVRQTVSAAAVIRRNLN